MIDKVLSAVEKHNMFSGISNVTVALSGGADSVCLLSIMCALADRFNISVEAAHFNHMIRGKEADSDEAFVKALCKKMGIKLHCKSGDVPSYAKQNHLSIELAARKMRYDFLYEVSKGIIATAHTASDNLETMLFNLTRGTALKGLCGIPAKRDGIIRPLIYCTREDIESYCFKMGLSYVTDSTNLSDDYSRNNIRHNVVAILKQINPSVERSATKAAEAIKEDADFIDTIAKDEFLRRFKNGTIDLKNYNDLSPAISKRVCMQYYNSFFDQSADNLHINAIDDICRNTGKVSIAQNHSAVSDGAYLKITDNCADNKNVSDFSVEIKICEDFMTKKNKKFNKLFLNNAIDYDTIEGELVIRTRLAGDSIRLSGRNCTKSLKKLYNEYSVPVSIREYVPVISDDLGVVWIYGIGVAERCAVSADTVRAYRISAHKIRENSGEEANYGNNG